MRKTQTQRNKEHIARLRRKAQAYDLLVAQLSSMLEPEPDDAPVLDWRQSKPVIRMFVKRAQQAVSE